MTPTHEQPVIYYDAQCRLCQASVRFIKRNDPHRRFAFDALQSEAGDRARRQANLPPDTAGSLVLRDQDGVAIRSEAALRIAARLRFPWPLLRVFRLCPRPLRDRLYDWVARNRYRWFGTVES